MTSRALGILQILLSGVCFGVLGLAGKSAYTHGVTPAELLSLRFFTAGALVVLGLGAWQRARFAGLTRPQVIWSLILGALGYAVFSFFYFQALTGLSVSLTVLLLYLYPVFVAVGAWLFLGERIPKERWFVLPLAMVGLALLVWGDFRVERTLSFVFGVGAALFYSVYILCSAKFLNRVDTLPSAGLMQLSAGLTLGAFAWRDGERLLEVVRLAWPSILVLALVCSIAAMTLFLSGLQKLRSWEATILSTSEPVTGILIAYLVLGERLATTQIFGGTLVLLAFIAVSLPARARTPNTIHANPQP